jgi:multidrug resistance efflux pump
MKNKIIPLAAVIVLLLAAISVVRSQPQRASNPPPVPPPRADFEHRVAAIGLIESASENISIASHLPGVVDRVFVAVGQSVQPGEPLIKLDTRALEAARTERRANIAVAQARDRKARAALAEARRNLRFAESVTDPGSISAEELSRRRSAVEIAEAEVTAGVADVSAAEAALQSVETDLQRSTVVSPIAGRVLQVRIRTGEFAPAGPTAQPWLIIGDTTTLHLRVEIDEHEAWRVRPGAAAVAQVRGNSDLRAELAFVRLEPLVVPKVSLTGASTERVDTRVLQAVYRFVDVKPPLFVGQQMDVFIDASPSANPALDQR